MHAHQNRRPLRLFRLTWTVIRLLWKNLLLTRKLKKLRKKEQTHMRTKNQQPQQNQQQKPEPGKSAVHMSAENQIPTDKDRKQAEQIGATSAEASQSFEQQEELNQDVNELCKDVIALGFEAWGAVSIKPKELSPKERDLLGNRLGAIMRKHNIDMKIADELVFCGVLGASVFRRVREENAAKNELKKQQGKETAGNENAKQV